MKAVSRRFNAPSRGGSMATHCITQITFGFDPKKKPVVARFDQAYASSDGGAILLKGIDTSLGLTKRLAAHFVDDRQPGKIQHQTLELVRQRVFGLVCGYADCNDAARLADDPIHKLLLHPDPLAGARLASQPTLSRFENAVEWRGMRPRGPGGGAAGIPHPPPRRHPPAPPPPPRPPSHPPPPPPPPA